MTWILITDTSVSKIAESMSDSLLREMGETISDKLRKALQPSNYDNLFNTEKEWVNWILESKKNCSFLLQLGISLRREAEFRKVPFNTTYSPLVVVAENLKFKKNKKSTEFPIVMSSSYYVRSKKTGKPLVIKSYREFFQSMIGWREHTWTNRTPPKWLLSQVPLFDSEELEIARAVLQEEIQ